MEALNRFKEEMLGLLLPLREVFQGGEADVGEVAALLSELMKTLEVEEKPCGRVPPLYGAGRRLPRQRVFGSLCGDGAHPHRDARSAFG